MSSPFEHPGSPPQRPELPEGAPTPFLPPQPPAPAPWPPTAPVDVLLTPSAGTGEMSVLRGRIGLPPFPVWAPFLAMLITLVVALIGFTLITIGVEAAGTPVDPDDPPTGVTVGGTLIQDLALIVSAIGIAALVAGRPSPAMFGLRRTHAAKAVGWTLLCFFAFYVFAFIWALALGIEESDDLAEELGAKDSTLNLVVVTLLVTIVAPITEEFFFRGFLFPAIWRRTGMWLAAVVTGVIFGLIHAGGTKAEFLVPLAVFGFLLCLLYRYTGSLLPCIALHAVNNALALGVTLEWEVWQVLVAVVGAPVLVLSIVAPITAARAKAPAGAPA